MKAVINLKSFPFIVGVADFVGFSCIMSVIIFVGWGGIGQALFY